MAGGVGGLFGTKGAITQQIEVMIERYKVAETTSSGLFIHSGDTSEAMREPKGDMKKAIAVAKVALRTVNLGFLQRSSTEHLLLCSPLLSKYHWRIENKWLGESA